ncbi:hypothetical protein HJC23_000786 [Cyclotella cryptica]|uniref:Glutaredoxin-like protein n=1 Tax=Cyclotella cryptica TaxID=29204 RepID=A0ABD3Q057_9STRA|eukprot:CCRYP_010157-RB/>CCRYP_010157-RB protein AED:0.03 eAED:0.03 QI:244/1/1/1/1/1/3/1126/163
MLIHRLIAIGSVTFVKSRFTRGVFVIPQRGVHLPSRRYLVSSDDAPIQNQSVTGPIYEMPDSPSVKLFTKQGCTLCYKVKDILESVREEHPHSLYAVDITDDDKEHWFSKYKYDIPVLHIDDVYWTKHRLTVEDAIAGIEESRDGRFDKRQGEPDASRLERKS